MIKKLGKNIQEIKINDMRVLVSYETPVALYCPNDKYLVSSKFFSKTTTKHVNSWLKNNVYTLTDHETLLKKIQA